MTDPETMDALRETLETGEGEVEIATLRGTPAPTIQFDADRNTVTPEEHELKDALATECRPVLVAAAEFVEYDPSAADVEGRDQLAALGEALLDADPAPERTCLVAVADYLGTSLERVRQAIDAAEESSSDESAR